jgi:putative nucleotidyltransferase with HDIG domain
MNGLKIGDVQRRIAELDSIPTVPALLVPLLHRLGQPADEVDLPEIVALISSDKSLTAQCLHMANSPLFGRRKRIDTVHHAVTALGLRRVREVATTCCLLHTMPAMPGSMRPTDLWKHSLGCALVCRHFARKVGYADTEQAYLAGLLHDLGLIVELTSFPKEFEAVAHAAFQQRSPLHEVERVILGLDHCVIGAMLAEHWALPLEQQEVIRWHHDVEKATMARALVSIVNLSDILCRMRNLGYGFDELRQVDLLTEPGWSYIADDLPDVKNLDLARFTLELDAYLEEIERLVTALFSAA